MSSTIVCDLREYQYIHPSYAVLIASSIDLGKYLGKRVVIRYNKANPKAVSFLSRSGLINPDTIPGTSSLDESNVPFRRFKKLEDTFDTIQHKYSIVSDDRDFNSPFCKGILYSANPNI